MTFSFPAASYLNPISRIYLVVGGAGVAAGVAWLIWQARLRAEGQTV